MEKDLGMVFLDRFLVPAMAGNPSAARQIHEAAGMPLAMLFGWCDHPEADTSWKPWNHASNHGSDERRLNGIEEMLIEDALPLKIHRKRMWIIARWITIETRGGWIDMRLSSVSSPMHRVLHLYLICHLAVRCPMLRWFGAAARSER
jgi:hypothetical protein